MASSFCCANFFDLCFATGALETVEKIAKEQTDGSYAPWYFFFCPVQSKLLHGGTVFTL